MVLFLLSATVYSKFLLRHLFVVPRYSLQYFVNWPGHYKASPPVQ